MRPAALALMLFATACPPPEEQRCNVDGDCGAGRVCNGGTCAVAEPCQPGTEIPGDGVDQDCDRLDACYVDSDDDGVGAEQVVAGLSLDCAADPRRAARPGDCADDDGTRHAGASEVVADGIDQDCDGADSCFADVDGDGFGASAVVVDGDLDCGNGSAPAMADNDLDCDDAAPLVNPNGSETAGDDVDESCDGVRLCHLDTDGDGAGGGGTGEVSGPTCASAGFAVLEDDCAPDDPARHPGADEVAADGVDQDCDGVDACYGDGDGDGHAGSALVDDTDLDCANASAPTFVAATDCDDGDGAVHPGGVEGLADGEDGDCDGLELCRLDTDQDGFAAGATGASADLSCRAAGFARFAGDCDDGSAINRPGSSCSDGDACTAQDACSDGACAGVPTTDGGCCASGCPASGCCSAGCSQQDCPACSGAGQECVLQCQGGRCPAQCSNGARCFVDATAGNNATLDCADALCGVEGMAITTCTGASCRVDAAAESTVSCRAGSLCTGGLRSGVLAASCEASACLYDVEPGVTVSCSDGALCELQCATGSCTADCTGGSSCLVACPGGSCTLQCDEAASSCANDVTVCGRACP